MLFFITAVLLFACAPDHRPLAPLTPAGKINPQTTVAPSERLFVVWDCGADQWTTAQDSTWTLFYPQSRFLITSEGIRITEYLDDNRKAVYDAFPETNPRYATRARAEFITHENQCALWSDIIDRDSVYVRLYRGDIFWKWRTIPLHAQYILRTDDEETQVAQTLDGLVVHPSFGRFAERLHWISGRPVVVCYAEFFWPGQVKIGPKARSHINLFRRSNTVIFVLAVVLSAASACADNGPDLSDVEWSEVSADLLLLDPRWDYFDLNLLDPRSYAFGDQRFDYLRRCDGYASRSFDGGAAVILRECNAQKLRDGKAYWLLEDGALDKYNYDEDELITLNGYKYGYGPRASLWL